MRRSVLIRLQIFLRQCRYGLVIMVAWFAFGTFAFYRWDRMPLWDALKNALYLGHNKGSFWDLYSFWGQWILFGLVVAVFVLQALERYNPREVCRMLARETKDHAIVVGYTNLGKRIVEHFRGTQQPYVLIEKDSTAVEDLVRAGEPIIVDNATVETTLEEAGVERAQLVIVATNDIETAMLVIKRVRARNKVAHIIVRCFQDEFAEILENLGANEVISSSKSTFQAIAHKLAPKN